MEIKQNSRRKFIKKVGIGALAASTITTANATVSGKTGFLLVHGAWHGGWCWGKVERTIENKGHLSLAIDLPGSGLNAVSPKSFFNRPIDGKAFSSEVSQFAKISSEMFADSVLEGADTLRSLGAEKIVAVGHSMGGIPIALAASKSPSALQGIIFLTAYTATPNKPAGAYLQVPEQLEKSMVRGLLRADPEIIGAVRIDPASTDEQYYENAKEAFAADVEENTWRTALNMMAPDAPVGIFGEVVKFPEEYSKIERTYIRCTKDKAIVPETQDAIISDLNSAWPDNPCTVLSMDTSHEAMFVDPQGLGEMILSKA